MWISRRSRRPVPSAPLASSPTQSSPATCRGSWHARCCADPLKAAQRSPRQTTLQADGENGARRIRGQERAMATQHDWYELAQQLRVDSIRSTTAAGSGHPTSSMSAADLMAVLLYEHLRYNFDDPHNPNNDHLIFSKGHAAPLLYSIFKAAGAISDEELLSLRKFGSRLQGHPVPILPWVDVATGSLGQGLPIGVGIGLAGKYLDKLPYRIWVVLGDSEMSKGSCYEALELGGHYQLNNLIGILDMNRLGQRGETMLGWDSEAYAARARSFGWHAIQIDGHNLDQINAAYQEAERQTSQPTLIVARTVKGKGVAEVENKEGWHGKAFSKDLAERAIAELGGERHITVQVRKPESHGQPAQLQRERAPLQLPRYDVGSQVATRTAYGDGLKTGHLIAAMTDRRGISYLRTTREKTPVIYGPDESFPIGGSKVVRQSSGDRATVVAAGITLHEALKAYDQLRSEGIAIRVIDAYTVKPIDVATLREAAAATNGRLIVVEDHWEQGGLGDAVLDAFAGSEQQPAGGTLPRVTKLGVHEMPGSGAPDELLDAAGIS